MYVFVKRGDFCYNCILLINFLNIRHFCDAERVDIFVLSHYYLFYWRDILCLFSRGQKNFFQKRQPPGAPQELPSAPQEIPTIHIFDGEQEGNCLHEFLPEYEEHIYFYDPKRATVAMEGANVWVVSVTQRDFPSSNTLGHKETTIIRPMCLRKTAMGHEVVRGENGFPLVSDEGEIRISEANTMAQREAQLQINPNIVYTPSFGTGSYEGQITGRNGALFGIEGLSIAINEDTGQVKLFRNA